MLGLLGMCFFLLLMQKSRPSSRIVYHMKLGKFYLSFLAVHNNMYRLIRYKSDYTYQVLRPFLAVFCDICMVIFHKTEIQTVILRCLTGQNLEFWKYDSWFPSEDSKLTSVGNKLKLLLKYWFFEAKVGIWICYGPKKWSKYLVDTIQTTFCK